MAWRRFHVEAHQLVDGEVTITGELLHHIRDVCRFGVGDKFEILTGNDQAHLVDIQVLSAKSLTAHRLSTRTLTALAKPYLTLALSLPKLPKVDWIVEKCVELGAFEIRPFVSEYSFLRKVSEISPNRLERWRKLVLSATQQSGRGDVLKIAAPVSLSHLLEDFNRQTVTGGLFPYEGEAPTGLAEALNALRSRELDHVWVFVGSEVGFSPAEVNLFASYNLKPVSLGERILRVETACLALVSIIKYELGGGVI